MQPNLVRHSTCTPFVLVPQHGERTHTHTHASLLNTRHWIHPTVAQKRAAADVGEMQLRCNCKVILAQGCHAQGSQRCVYVSTYACTVHGCSMHSHTHVV